MTDTPRTGNLTKEEIFDAADAIRERGDLVTQDSIRAECDNRGSKTTINRYLKAWKEKNEATNERISREVTPELERYGLNLVAQISELIGQRADDRCAELDAGHKARMDLKETIIDDACAEADHYHALLAEAKARITELLGTIDASEAASVQHIEEAKALRGNIRDLETNRDINVLRIQQDQQKISTLETKIGQALTSAGHFEGVASRLKEQLSEQTEQLAESSRIIGAYEESFMRADEEEDRMRAQIENLSKQRAGLAMANCVLLGTSQICLPKPANRDHIVTG